MIRLSRIGPMAHKSKTNSRSITKIGRKVPHDTYYIVHTSFKVKRSKLKVTGRLTQTHKMCHIFRRVKPKNFKVSVWMEDIDPHQRQPPRPSRLKFKIISSHRLYVSYLPILNSGNEMVYLCYLRRVGACRVGRTRPAHCLFVLLGLMGSSI